MGFGGSRKDKTAVDLEALSTLTADDILTLSGGVVVNEAAEDRDFRVESQSNTHALFVDASTSTVGIGTSGPGDYNDSADNLVVYRDGNGGITIANGVNDYGTIYFADALSGQDGSHAGAVQYHHGTDKLFFGTAATDQRVTIDSSGNLGIGTTNPNTPLHVTGTTTFAGGVLSNRKALAVDDSPYTVAATDTIIGCNTTGGGILMILPAPTAAGIGRTIIIKDEGRTAGTNNITVTAGVGNTIDGDQTILLDVDGSAVTIYNAGGTEWHII